MKIKKIVLLCACLFIVSGFGCTAQKISTSPNENVTSAAVSGIPVSHARPEPTEGTLRCGFQIKYRFHGTSPHEYVNLISSFCLDLPEEWIDPNTDQKVTGPTVIPDYIRLEKNGAFIGSITLLPQDKNDSILFGEIDAGIIAKSASFTKEFTVSNDPAKLYVIESDMEDFKKTKPNCIFFIAPDSMPDVYVELSFLSGVGTVEELETIVSSFYLDKIIYFN